ncbi:DUF4468 domain-containing protein [Confluentibacter flavum]|uniref:DUF4468 domain-containing protein n=1 Tax=Confluentibacter flavum TaxID=1909700 RepID=UPI0021D2F601|nr:DUF4468 domain-containing protein [Confluentibacter flavum]
MFEFDSILKNDIHSKLMSWVAINYKSANDVVQLNTADKIIVKGNFTVNSNFPTISILNTINYYPVNISFNHTLIIYIKDNRFKVDISFPEKTKVITLSDTDYFYDINQYNLDNIFTIYNMWATLHGYLC